MDEPFSSWVSLDQVIAELEREGFMADRSVAYRI